MADYPVLDGLGNTIVAGYEVDVTPTPPNDVSEDYPTRDGLGNIIIPDRGIVPITIPARADTSGRTAVSRYPTKDGLGNDIIASRAGDGPAFPAWKANGTVGAATTGTTVAGPLPTYAADDILLAEMFCRGSSTAFTMPAGWNEIAQLTVGGNQHALFWRRATASESNPTVTNLGRASTNLLAAQLTSFSGCRTSGTPYEGAVSNSSASGPLAGVAVVTSGAKRLALQAWIKAANTATVPGAAWTERLDQGTGGGGACRFMLDTDPVAAPGTAPAASRALTAETYAVFGLALIP